VKRVAIVGTGLIGSSFGLALRKAGYDGAIVGVDLTLCSSDGEALGGRELLGLFERQDRRRLSQCAREEEGAEQYRRQPERQCKSSHRISQG